MSNFGPYTLSEFYKQSDNQGAHAALREVDVAYTVPSDGNTLFHLAAEYADHEGIAILLERDGKPSKTNNSGWTPLHTVARLKPVGYAFQLPEGAVYACTKLLIQAKCSLLRKNADGKAPLHLAALQGRDEFIRAVVEAQANLDIADTDGNTALHLIAEASATAIKDDLEASQKLEKEEQEAAATGDQSSRSLLSARKDARLQRAKVEGFLRCTQLLIEGGADAFMKNNAGKTPIDIAQERLNKPVCALLMGENDAETDETDNASFQSAGMTLSKAVLVQDYSAISALLQMGADPNQPEGEEKDFLDCSPLTIAISSMDAKAALLLLEGGADPNWKNSQGYTPARFFIHHPRSLRLRREIFTSKVIPNILQAMLGKGFDVDGFVDDDSNTLLNFACLHAPKAQAINDDTLCSVVIDALLYAGADTNLANLQGKSPLMHVASANSGRSENLLLALLENDAAVNAVDANGHTVLMYAAQNPNAALAKTMAALLFDFGDPNIDAVNNDGQTALAIASKNNNEPLVQMLLMKA